MKNFHLPLPVSLYDQFIYEAKSQGRVATKLARDILQEWLKERKKQKIAEEITQFAETNAGTDVDIDLALEKEGLQTIS